MAGSTFSFEYVRGPRDLELFLDNFRRRSRLSRWSLVDLGVDEDEARDGSVFGRSSIDCSLLADGRFCSGIS